MDFSFNFSSGGRSSKLTSTPPGNSEATLRIVLSLSVPDKKSLDESREQEEEFTGEMLLVSFCHPGFIDRE